MGQNDYFDTVRDTAIQMLQDASDRQQQLQDQISAIGKAHGYRHGKDCATCAAIDNLDRPEPSIPRHHQGSILYEQMYQILALNQHKISYQLDDLVAHSDVVRLWLDEENAAESAL